MRGVGGRRGGVCWKGRQTVTKRSGPGDMIRLVAEYFIQLGLNLCASDETNDADFEVRPMQDVD